MLILGWCGQSFLGSLRPWLSHLHFKEGNTWTASAVTWDSSVAYLKGLCPSAQGSWGSIHKSSQSACPDLCFLSTARHTVVSIKSLAHVHCTTPRLQVVKFSHLSYPSLQLLPCCLTVIWLAQTLSTCLWTFSVVIDLVKFFFPHGQHETFFFFSWTVMRIPLIPVPRRFSDGAEYLFPTVQALEKWGLSSQHKWGLQTLLLACCPNSPPWLRISHASLQVFPDCTLQCTHYKVCMAVIHATCVIAPLTIVSSWFSMPFCSLQFQYGGTVLICGKGVGVERERICRLMGKPHQTFVPQPLSPVKEDKPNVRHTVECLACHRCAFSFIT